jgi:predicted DNA-binding protein (UPF0251 family)/predicted Fe-Mo cluster-binding NifX family protein
VTYFKPAGIPLRALDEVRLSVEEAEALRLKELEGLEQAEGAERMSISRPTFQRVLKSARVKVVDALLNGKAIRIEGGHFEIATDQFRCANLHEWQASSDSGARFCPVCSLPAQQASNQGPTNINGGVHTVKIAVVSDDGTTVSQHFGRAPYYVVLTVEDGKVTSKERRDKAGHHTAGAHHGEGAVPGQTHGFDAAAQATHASMIANITDCQVLIAGGMGWGAQQSLKSAGIETVATEVKDIDEAVKLYLAGALANRVERLH